jgi:CheY-like chemotaxis protein
MSDIDSHANTVGGHHPGSDKDVVRLQIWDSAECFCSHHRTGSTESPLKVLLAEDNLIDQLNLCRLFEKSGAEVTLTVNGRQAVDTFENGKFDIVFLDILMPDMDGFEAALHIREKERLGGGRIPVIALTSYSLKAVCDKCKSVDMSGYISKPIDRRDLTSLFAALFQGYKSWTGTRNS